MITLNEYQQQLTNLTKSIKVEGDKTLFNCVGMAEEAGECLGKLKRAMRGEGFDREGYILELGDVLGYLAIAAEQEGFWLDSLFRRVQTTLVRSHVQYSTHIDSLDLLEVLNNTINLYHDASSMFFAYKVDKGSKESRIWENKFALTLQHITQCAYSVDTTLEEVMSVNLTKLRDRLERNGTLLGSGDNR